MRIIERGTPKPKYRWMRHPWQCIECRSIVEFDESDAGEEGYARNGAYVTLHESQRDGVWLEARCPVCLEVRVWHECGGWRKP